MKNLVSISCKLVFPLLTWVLLTPTSFAQQPDEAAEGVKVQRVVEEGVLRIKIPARDGKVAWEDVLRALLRVGYMDDKALKDRFPSGSLDLQQSYTRYSLIAINLALAPNIRMEVIAETDDAPAHLLLTVDEDAIEEKSRRLKKKLRNRITGGELRKGAFGLRLKEGAWKTDPLRPLVIVVHGFNSSPECFEPLAEALRKSGFTSATYSYPDDQPIADSAKQLSGDLKKHAGEYPQRPIYLVTHSMGGLVSRYAIEQPDLDPGTVAKLIMIAPPSHGSMLAHISFGIDIFEHATGSSMSNDVTRFYAAVEDGLSEAQNDLKPNSRFLRELNARSRNPKVQYSIFLGTGGLMDQSQVDRLIEGLRTAADRSTAVGLFAPHLTETLADLDEVIEGKGDGVVAVKRGRLEGVTDTMLADFTHLGVLQNPDTFADDKVFQALLQRLKK